MKKTTARMRDEKGRFIQKNEFLKTQEELSTPSDNRNVVWEPVKGKEYWYKRKVKMSENEKDFFIIVGFMALVWMLT